MNDHRFLKLGIAAVSLLALGLVLPACQSAKVGQPVTAENAGNQPDQQLAFWHTLATRPLTSNDEAFHGLLLFLDGKDDATDYAGRVKLLQDRKILNSNFDQPAENALQRGTLAVMMVRTLDIKGGVAMHLFGATERYALRELDYEQLMPPSGARQTITGNDFVGVIGRMEDYQRLQPTSGNESLANEIDQAKKLRANEAAPTTQAVNPTK